MDDLLVRILTRLVRVHDELGEAATIRWGPRDMPTCLFVRSHVRQFSKS